MNKQKILKVINPLMAIDFIGLVGTALLNDSIPAEVYSVLHPVLGYTFVFFLILHIVFNWSWIKNYFKK